MEEKEITSGEAQGQALPPKITKENINSHVASTKGQVLLWTRALLYTVLSAFLVSFAAHALITPNDFTIGGISGIAILLDKAVGVPQSVTILCFNLPLVLLSFFFVKKRFSILSAVNIGLQSLFLLLMETVIPDFVVEFTTNGEKIFAALSAGLCVGAAIAFAFKAGGSTGGTDILAVLIQKKIAAASIATMIFIINCVVIACSLFVFQGDTLAETLLPIMMAAFEAYIESRTNESVTNGFHSAREFRIITDKPDEMANALMHELSRGVTALPATGMYTKFTHTMLLCVVHRRQVVALKRIMKRVDPDSFAVMSNVSQVLGLGFYSDEI
ncbi:MAG: YitT family protein [Clostridia bacterium]|nr:YitT family protein [Clostridia bacterium]